MKKIILCALLFAGMASQAQTTHKKPITKKTSTKKTTVSSKINTAVSPANGTILLSTTTASAYSATSTSTRLSIADPVTNTLNAKAAGEPIYVGKSGLMGMPKRAFGFANGHLTLKPNSSTSTGTINGSGSVGTGSFPGSVGTGSMIPGVNGKNRYAGVDAWGTHLTGAGITVKHD